MMNGLRYVFSRWTLPLGLAALCLAFSAPAQAQDDQAAAQQQAVEKPKATVVKEERVAAKPLESARATASLKNVKVEVTIRDQSGPGAPTIKTVSAIMADMRDASVRTFVDIPTPGAPDQRVPLNVDVGAEIVDREPSLVRTRVSLNYGTARRTEGGNTPTPFTYSANLTQVFHVILEHGKPLVVGESADAATDRKVTIELKATILK